MAGLLDFIKGAAGLAADAAPGAMAARGGYLEGQTEKAARERQIQLQDAQLRRQSLLDQIKAQVDASTITRNNAQAHRYGTMSEPVTPVENDDGTATYVPRSQAAGQRAPRPANNSAPHTITTSQGIMQWDSVQKRYVPTGYKAPPRASDDNGEFSRDMRRYDAAVRATPRPSKVPQKTLGRDTQGRSTMVDNPDYTKAVTDSTSYDHKVLAPMREKLGIPDAGDDGPSVPLATRVQQLKAQGLSKAQAKAQLAQEGYDVGSQP